MSENENMYSERMGQLLEDSDYFVGGINRPLKGLLKPFKGKGDYGRSLVEVELAITQLEKFAERLITISKETVPLKYLPVFLRLRRPRNKGAVSLYWKLSKTITHKMNMKEEIEGAKVVNWMFNQPLTVEEKEFIKNMETDRLAINMQLSLLTRIRWFLREGITKLDNVNSMYTNSGKQ